MKRLTNKEISEILGVPVRTPVRGEKRDLMAMARENAQLSLDEKFRLLSLIPRRQLAQ